MHRDLGIVPHPRSVEFRGEDFYLASLTLQAAPPFSREVDAFAEDLRSTFGAAFLCQASSEEEVRFASSHLDRGARNWGGNFRSSSAPSAACSVSLDDALAPRAYRLSCAAAVITISAADGEGLSSALATLFRLLSVGWDGWRSLLPDCLIEDQPVFAWRGLMVDSARHFIPLPAMKRLVRLMAAFSINRLHWHLSDDQGWRLELKSHPELAEKGGCRSGEDPNRNGFYTQEEVRELVAYASARGVSIMPELDLPGHALAILASRPDLGCGEGPFSVSPTWGIFEDVLCLGNPDTLKLVFDVVDELADLFPSPWVHIGGDECPTLRWETCPRCAALKERLGLQDFRDLQGWFVGQVTERLRSRGKAVFGWDEILDSSAETGTGVFHWRAWEPQKAEEALRRGRDLVRSPSVPYYFDYLQTEDRNASPGIDHAAGAGVTTLRRVFEWDPFEGLSDDVSTQGKFLGLQANLWTEFIRDQRRLEYMTFPRLIAVAATAWSGAERGSWEVFHSRLSGQRRLLDLLGVNYCRASF